MHACVSVKLEFGICVSLTDVTLFCRHSVPFDRLLQVLVYARRALVVQVADRILRFCTARFWKDEECKRAFGAGAHAEIFKKGRLRLQ